MSRRPRSRRRSTRLAVGIVGTVVAGATLLGCSDDEPEATQAELLAEIEGRELSEAEVEERAQVAQALCRMDDSVLIELWGQLDSEQLEFQDFVFTRTCPDRNALYAETTGRFASGG